MTAADFRNWRQRLGLTQPEAARRLGLSVETVRAWEYGKRQISLPTVLELACECLESKA